MAKEYSIKRLSEAKKISKEKVNTKPLFMPVGYTRPETLNQVLERILSHSAARGQSLQEAYDMLSGEFDGDFDDDSTQDVYFPVMDDDDDGFEQSAFASYDIPTPAPEVSAEAEKSTAQVSPDSTSPSGDVTSGNDEVKESDTH